jgi:hypothetical protein
MMQIFVWLLIQHARENEMRLEPWRVVREWYGGGSYSRLV